MYSVIILAAGKGLRLNLGYNKVFYEIKNKSILEYSVDYFLKDSSFTEIIVVINDKDKSQIKEILAGKNVKITTGGITRQESVYNGLKKASNKYVLIHDGARPFICKQDIDLLKRTVLENACVLAKKLKESIAKNSFGKLKKYINRDEYVFLQTPQAFLTEKIIKAYELAIKNNQTYSDDASLYMQELEEDVIIVDGNEFNIKLTTELDLRILEAVL
ncbi:MAG: IspD/TarI family cytidylyltransferase [Candidatus Izemoplasmatales bacterium]|nr:IspD/TarI family cytidylyltransferase [Candidatus Izemoplasmatales bacterium]